MYINKKNNESYYDPTAFNAMVNVIRDDKRANYRPLVFICSPYAGNVKLNTDNACKYSRFALDSGCIPFAPHLLFPQFMDDTCREERELALFMGYVFMTKCNEMWVFGSYISPGMTTEIEKADRHGIQIKYFDEKLQEVCK